MNTNENQHDFSQEVQSAIFEAIKMPLEKLKTIKKNQEELEGRVNKYSEMKAKIEQDILELQTEVINGGDEKKLTEITSLKLTLQSIDDIVKGVEANRAELSKDHDKALDAIGHKTNAAYTSIKNRFQDLVNEEASQFMGQLESRHIALKTNLSPSSFVPELKDVSIKTLNTQRQYPFLKLPNSFNSWV